MTLASGTRLGPYEIAALIGAGGMGEVYRARDTRLKRDVAIKLLPAALAQDAERIRRFELEAQTTGALNHPNILAVLDVGVHEGAPYLVCELLEGQSLRERLAEGALPSRKATDLALQAVQGLAAAHEKGIVHRDLKPDNLFVTKDGRLKILDFGLARLVSPPDQGSVRTLASPGTEQGMVLGTVGYMAPEQVRGLPADHRADIFAFGAVLYEMLSGRRAFSGPSNADTMTAILREDPPELASPAGAIPPALESIVLHCLEKAPEERFQSARDLAFHLALITQATETGSRAQSGVQRPSRGRSLRWPVVVATCCAAVALLGAGLLLGRLAQRPPEMGFKRLTFRRGVVTGARFVGDGASVAYSAAWEGAPAELYTVRFESPESSPLGFSDAHLLAISPASELALQLQRRAGFAPWAPAGILARAPFGGGAPRAIEERVALADFSPDGKELAVVRETEAGVQLEYPVGSVLYRTSGYVSCLRISPAGDLVGFLDHPLTTSTGGAVAVVDRKGKKRDLTGQLYGAEGMAWSPNGSELWVTATFAGGRQDLRAVTLSGRQRVLFRQTAHMALQDVATDGRVLVTTNERRARIFFRGEDDASERELSWLDWSILSDLSPDGRWIALSESGEGAGESPLVYLRETNGAPAMKLGSGQNPTFSPDAQSVVATLVEPPGIVIYPVGTGQPRTIPLPGYAVGWAGLLPGGKGIWFDGGELSRPRRFYVMGLDGERPRPVTPEGVRFARPGITPDGSYVVGKMGAAVRLYPIAGGDPLLLKGVQGDDEIAGWSGDGESLFTCRRTELPVQVFRASLATGSRTVVREIVPSERSGVGSSSVRVIVTPDARSYAYLVRQTLSELHLIEGIR
ncbi:MAG: protein kinase [Acidobacteriota bacterium]